MSPLIYAECIQAVLGEVIQHGIYEYFKKEAHNVVTPKYESTIDVGPPQIDMEDLMFIFYILGFGNCAGLVMFLCEVVLGKLTKTIRTFCCGLKF